MPIINAFALWRDSSEHIERTLAQLDSLIALQGFQFNLFFYENDSKDDTIAQLKSWKEKNADRATVEILSEKLNAPRFGSVPSNVRTSMLSYYRNKNREMGAKIPSDYSLVIDSDLTWTAQDFLELFGQIRLRDDVVMVTSNCRQNVPDYVFNRTEESYYDVYCLRDKWGNNGMYFSDAPFYDENDNVKFLGGAVVEIKSGFGGLAMIKSNVFNKIRWSADFHSEHVNFCYDAGRYGKILAVPTSRPFAQIDLSKLNLDNCRKIAHDELVNYQNGNQLRNASVMDKWVFGGK